jgi:hypothetical protein
VAELKFQIPDARMDDLINAWGQNYMETLVDGSPNPQTKQQFARQQIMNMITQRIKDHQASQQPDFPIT